MRRRARLFQAVLMALVGSSRIYRSERWFSDVLAVYLLGAPTLYGMIRVYPRSVATFLPQGARRADDH